MNKLFEATFRNSSYFLHNILLILVDVKSSNEKLYVDVCCLSLECRSEILTYFITTKSSGPAYRHSSPSYF